MHASRLLPRPPTSHSPTHPPVQAYELTHELYGNTRMLLAVLDREQLAEVCQVS